MTRLCSRRPALETIKILWRKNIVKLEGKVLYKQRKEERVYKEEGLFVKDVVEEFVKQWVSDRDAEESD